MCFERSLFNYKHFFYKFEPDNFGKKCKTLKKNMEQRSHTNVD